MCGIVCYLGSQPAVPILIDGLKRLEYRGYDSSGFAVHEPDGILCCKAQGKIAALEARSNGHGRSARVGIAHTRWATHGKPSEVNAHPHSDCCSEVFVVHNGIIENADELRFQLEEKGHLFLSETDTEVLAHLIEDSDQEGLADRVKEALSLIRGAFGIAVLSQRDPEQIVVARRGSPLVIGASNGDVLAASDISALVRHTRDVVYLEDDDVAVLSPGTFRISNLKAKSIDRKSEPIDWDVTAAQKSGYPHFMLKEIFEQPEAVRNAFRGRLLEQEGTAKLGGLETVRSELAQMERLLIVSCGTSYYAGLLGRYLLETFTDLGVEVDVASEFRYRTLRLRPGTVVLAISQSGETADTLASLREAKLKGALTLGIVNVVGSTISRETHAGIYNHAGPEIGVASTKAFISQITILYLFTLLLGRSQQKSITEGQEYIRELKAIPEKIQQVLDHSSRIEEIARKYAWATNFLFVGRKFNYPIAMEGALKLKEISYLHAEAYAAGEMKHGPIALVDEKMPTVCIAPADSSFEKMASNIQEIRARKGPVIAIGTEGDRRLEAICDDLIPVPNCPEVFSPMLTVVPLQLFAYYMAREMDREIDQPRNLAKSVTVE